MRPALLLLLLAGCASKNSSIDQSMPAQRVIYTGTDVPTMMTDRPLATGIRVNKPLATVWPAVKQVYAEFEVPVTVDNAAAHQTGSPDFYKTRQFVGRPLTQLVNCGSGILGENAATYRIYMSLLTTVTDDGQGGSVVQTTFSAAARDMVGGASNDRLPCGSTGRLEKMFNDRVKALIGP